MSIYLAACSSAVFHLLQMTGQQQKDVIHFKTTNKDENVSYVMLA